MSSKSIRKIKKLQLIPLPKKGRGAPNRSTFTDPEGVLYRKCGICDDIKSLDEFPDDPKLSRGKAYYCVPCERFRKNKSQKASGLMQRHGITTADFYAMLVAQQAKCVICGRRFARTPHVDHDHRSGKIRALLCFGCNIMLGNAKDRPEVLEIGAAYLRKHHAESGYLVQNDPSGSSEERPVEVEIAPPVRRGPRLP